MTGRIFTSDHKVYDLPALLSWNVAHTGGVPCDSYTVKFLYGKEMAATLRLAAGFMGVENGQIVARGIVDEYTVELGSEGIVATITGRGAAARLLDESWLPGHSRQYREAYHPAYRVLRGEEARRNATERAASAEQSIPVPRARR